MRERMACAISIGNAEASGRTERRMSESCIVTEGRRQRGRRKEEEEEEEEEKKRREKEELEEEL